MHDMYVKKKGRKLSGNTNTGFEEQHFKNPTCNLHWLIGSHNISGPCLCVGSTHDSQVLSRCWSIAGLWFLGGHTFIHLCQCILERTRISHCVLMRTFW